MKPPAQASLSLLLSLILSMLGTLALRRIMFRVGEQSGVEPARRPWPAVIIVPIMAGNTWVLGRPDAKDPKARTPQHRRFWLPDRVLP